jgi:hypothetical protein
MKRLTRPWLLLISALLMSGCSHNASSAVQAAPSGYSNASLNGTYLFVDRSSGAIGKFVFDGNGNYTGGSVQSGQEIFGCLPADFSGTYSVSSDGSATGTFNCQGYSTNVTIEATQSGSSFVITGGNPETLAVKQ